MTIERLTYRPNEAAEALGTSRDVIFKLIASGELQSFQAGRARLIPATALKDYIARKLAEASA